jgi:hypothetical protein
VFDRVELCDLVRLIRLGSEPSEVGADVRAALSTWGVGDSVLGGIALLGIQPPGSPRPVDAVVVLPRGVIVIVGVDLPDPAMRLEAPLNNVWKIDGWPLVRPDGAVSPAAEALEAALAVTQRLQTMRAEPLPVSTLVAVGPYVGQVVQPTVDLNRGVRVLHPKPTTLLAAARELATSDRPCSVDHAAKLVAVLITSGSPPGTRELLAEGFADAVTTDLASAHTMLLPKLAKSGKPAVPSGKTATPRWLPYLAAALVGLLVVVGIIIAATSGSGSQATPSTSATPQPTTVVVDGANFSPRGAARDEKCAEHAYGDVKAWLVGHTCLMLRRAQYETSVGDRKIGVEIAEVSLPDAARAQEFQKLAATAGAGGVTELVKEGRTWSGAPKSFDRCAFTTTAKGSQVRFAQAVWVEGASTPTDPALKTAAEQALRLPANQ